MSGSPSFLPGEVAHVDVRGPDIDLLAAFYGTVLGWVTTPQGPGYALVETPGVGPNAALVETPDAALVVGVVVADVAAAMVAAERAGGHTLMPPVDNGWVVKAQVADPAGNVLTLIQR